MSDDRNDSATGHDRAPDRYMAHGRETIDRQRDLAHKVARGMVPDEAVPAMADVLFVYLCVAQSMRYNDRLGRKGDPAEDAKKRAFYDAMAEHICFGTPDPRSDRPGFTPYVCQPFEVDP